MKFLQQIAPLVETHAQAIEENLEESSVITALDQLRRYTIRDIADFAFIHFLVLFILNTDYQGAVVAKGHAARTLSHGNFKKLSFVGTDLYVYVHLLLGHNREKLKHTAASDIFYQRCHLQEREVKSMLVDLKNGHYNEAKVARFLLSLEKDLQIETSNYRSCRRLVQDWNEITTLNQKLVITRLLQAFRSRCSRADLLTHLEKYAIEKRYEIKQVKNPECLKEEEVMEAFNSGKAVHLGPSNFGIGGTFSVDGKDYFIEFEDYGHEVYEVTFGLSTNQPGKSKFSPTNDASASSALQVYSIVMSTFETFVDHHEPKRIFFTGRKDSGLEKLYLAMVKKLKGRLESRGYTFTTHSNGQGSQFNFDKVDNEGK